VFTLKKQICKNIKIIFFLFLKIYLNINISKKNKNTKTIILKQKNQIFKKIKLKFTPK